MTDRLEDRDTRAQGKRILSALTFNVPAAFLKTMACLLLAAALTLGGQSLGWFAGLEAAGVWMLFILFFTAGLWIVEAMPAFVVAILIIALEILILGKPGGVLAGLEDRDAWLAFVSPWSSSIMWLFLGGFVLAAAAVKTQLDLLCARKVVGLCGDQPWRLLAGVMLITFVFSMFMSNTATAAMMVAVMAPVTRKLPPGDKFALGLLLSVPIAANLGGIGTIIGTPPNAIAVGALSEDLRPSFFAWMKLGVPVALIMGVIGYFYLLKFYPSGRRKIDISQLGQMEGTEADPTPPPPPAWQQVFVMAVFLFAVASWMTESFHGTPPAVVSFFAIALLAVSGILQAEDMRRLPWDVLLMLAGGLALGVGITETGVGAWLPGLLPENLSPLILTFVIAYLALLMSNVMSNTATAAMLLPVAIALTSGIEGFSEMSLAFPVAIACSSAMCLPISTPPNAIAYASGLIRTKDYLRAGLLLGALAPLVAWGVSLWQP
ncbi:MAG: DASS family sodium-coupled anion symporter [Verrucomicrobiota bacterium]